MTLRDKTAIVFGGSSGVGEATAVALAQEGARVVAVARGEGRLRELAAKQAGIEVAVGDASEPSTSERLLRELRPELVVVAGGVQPAMGTLDELSWPAFSAAWESDVKATFHVLRTALALPLPSGSTIAIVSSGAAKNGSFLSGGYAGAKRMQWMLAGYAERMAEARGLDLRAVAVVPTQLIEGTAIAGTAAAKYGATLGLDARAYLDRFEVPLLPAMVGQAILTVLRRELAAGTVAIAVSGTGVAPLA